MSFPDKKYKVIYADPPWSYNNTSVGAKSDNYEAAAVKHYQTLSLDEICKIPVWDLADKDCVLFLWATTPLLDEAFEVMREWGFTYKTAIYWRKIMSLGMGYWFRGQVEVCLVGITGNVKAFHLQTPNFFQSKAGRHSEKPREIRGLINEISLKQNLLPKIELFARERIEGWDCWGNELPTSEQKLLFSIDI